MCSVTLGLGIDVGAVKRVAQIGPRPSVASRRQRLGRSGRREREPAILGCSASERERDDKSGLSDLLREGLVQTVAMVRLLIAGWFEPPKIGGLHASTLVQQILSVIAERGGVTAAHLWSKFIQGGLFGDLSRDDFVALLRYLGEKELLVQESSGLLLHGVLGEKLVNHYEFYLSLIHI